MDQIEIEVNGRRERRPDGITVEGLLDALGLGSSPCAVEVNRRLAPRAEHAATRLAEGDRVEIVTLVGGG